MRRETKGFGKTLYVTDQLKQLSHELTHFEV